MSDSTKYGLINIENNGNTSIHAEIFHYGDKPPKPNSDGTPHFEGAYWGIDDFYLSHQGQTISLARKRIFIPSDIPRHAEVIDGKAYIIAGAYDYPNSKQFEKKRIEFLNLDNGNAQDIKQTHSNWLIAEMEPAERTEQVNLLKNPRGTEFWTYNELQSNDLANKIVSRAGNGDGTNDCFKMGSGLEQHIDAWLHSSAPADPKSSIAALARPSSV